MRRKSDRTTAVPLKEFRWGKDENNLAEFPLALLTDRAPKGQKTIEFQDTINDWATGQVVTRRVCVTGSDKFGLPTAKDEEVLLALIQLTKLANCFTNPEVWFIKREVIELLGWPNRGWAYDRVEEALHRWRGVSIHYWNAWRDNKHGTWRSTEALGVIEYFRITDGRRVGRTNDDTRSRFLWNRILFESFQAGYLKPLDFGVYRGLKRSAAKRAYRFLDKRFHHQPNWEFDLNTFACDKLGFSRRYDTGQLKARLKPALGELESSGFIEPVEYRKGRPKSWTITICKKLAAGKQQADAVVTTDSSGLSAALIQRGVEARTANDLVGSVASDIVEDRLNFFDWLVARQDKRVSGNPPGFLVAAIRDSYPLPKDYRNACKKHLKSTPRVPKTKAPSRTPASNVLPLAESRDQLEVRAYLNTLSDHQLKELEANAVCNAGPMVMDGYQRSKDTSGPAFTAYRQMLLECEVRRLLGLTAPEDTRPSRRGSAASNSS